MEIKKEQDTESLTAEEKAKRTPLWQSFFLNPSTWIFISIILASIGLLIQGVNPAVFAQAAATLGIMQMLLVGLVMSMLIAGLLYSIAYAIHEKRTRIEYSTVDENGEEHSIEVDNDRSSKNLIARYFAERRASIFRNRETFVLVAWIWGVGSALLVVFIGFTIKYFAGGLIPDSLMGHLFSFMSQVFLLTIHALAGFPGLEFLGDISDATLLFVGEIISAVMLSLAIFFITDNVSRMAETFMPKVLSLLDLLMTEEIEGKASDLVTISTINYKYTPADLNHHYETQEYLVRVKDNYSNPDSVWPNFEPEPGILLWVMKKPEETDEAFKKRDSGQLQGRRLDNDKPVFVQFSEVDKIEMPVISKDDSNYKLSPLTQSVKISIAPEPYTTEEDAREYKENNYRIFSVIKTFTSETTSSTIEVKAGTYVYADLTYFFEQQPSVIGKIRGTSEIWKGDRNNLKEEPVPKNYLQIPVIEAKIQ